MKLKSLLSIAGVVLFFVGAIVSCGPSKAEREEAARQDSIRIADSIAKAEEEARLAAIEAARQDSLARIEKFKESIPPFKEIYLHFALVENKYTKKVNLEELGFVKKVKGEKVVFDGMDEEIYMEKVTYRLELDPEHYCEIRDEEGYECRNLYFKIVGFPDLMDKYKSEARALKSSPDFTKYSVSGEPIMEINKDEIYWQDGI
ncbi:MAG: hypothetical protein K2K98_01955 [Muribaculaceae bacterium]|nr:hypothetical protein [Muribaculaceae bacterium]